MTGRALVDLRRWVAAVVLAAAVVGDGGCKAESPWPLWGSYAAKFLDDQGRVIDHGAQDVTTTEGEAYAMFFALVANDQARFSKLVDWTESNMAQGDLTLHLPAWSWGKASDGGWRVLDANPAADADLWMAYTLCEAGRLWDNDRYAKLGAVMVKAIAQQEVVAVPQLGTTLLPGAKGFQSGEAYFLNPSYLPPFLLQYFAKRDPQSPWREVLRSVPAVTVGPQGFAMDWVKAGAGGVVPSAPPAAVQDAQTGGRAAAAAMGSYDAIRVYLWLGLSDAKTPGVKASLEELHGMALYLQTHTAPPAQVDATGKIVNPEGPPGFSAAVIPYLHALGLKSQEKAQSDRLGATQDAQTKLFGRGANYYDQNLALFEVGWSEQRYRFEADGRLHVKWK